MPALSLKSLNDSKLDINGTAVNSQKVNGLTVQTAVPTNAIFTDTITSINGKTGAIQKADIVALGINPQAVISDVQPATNLSDGLIWYAPTLSETKVYLNNSFRTVGSNILSVYDKNTTLVSDSNSVSIGIPSYNKDRDGILVIQNSVTLTKNVDYTVSSDSSQIVKTSGTWPTGTQFYFVVFGTISGNGDILKVVRIESSYTASSNGITNIPINSSYNPTNDVLKVYLNNVPLFDDSYSLNANQISIDLLGFSLNSGDVVHFEVWKNIRTDLDYTDGTLLQAGTVNVSAMSTNTMEYLDDSLLLDTSTVVTSGNITNITYKRKDGTKYKTIDYSNFDSNNKPQTVVAKWYASNGTTVLKTNTYANTYDSNGNLLTSTGTRS